MDDLGDAAVALLPDLVAIDSVNPGLVEGAAGESAIVAFLANRLRANGFTVTIINAEGRANRPSLLAVGPGPSDAPTVVLNGHLDTVGVSGMPSPFTPRVEGHQLFGRGAADMKGGVAAMVVAAERLAADHLTTAHLATSHPSAERSTGSRGIRPVLALVADEEDASLGSEAVIAALAALSVQPDVCLMASPPTSPRAARCADSASPASASQAARRTARSPTWASTRSLTSGGSCTPWTSAPHTCTPRAVTSW